MNMEKKTNESFRQYAQRWREEAAQVHPPLTEKEMTVMFIDTLKAPYYDRLVGNATKNFADMVISGEMIDKAVRTGKISAGEPSSFAKKSNPRGKDKEVSAINEASIKPGRNQYSGAMHFSGMPYSSLASFSPSPQQSYSSGHTPAVSFASNSSQNVVQNS